RKHRRKKHYFPFVVLVSVFAILEFWHPGKTIYITVIAFVVCALLVAFVRSDLIPTMFVGAAVFTLLYLALFLYFLALYPDFVQRYYNVPNLLGIYVSRVTIEERRFGTSSGLVWRGRCGYLQG